VVARGLGEAGMGLVIALSRAVLYPPEGDGPWQGRVRQAAWRWRERINRALEAAGRGWDNAPSP
jgi:hypothetical protein